MKCARCGSQAINDHLHGREKGKDLDLCDVCYWRKRAETLLKKNEDLHKEGMTIYAMMEDGRAKAVAKRCAEICEQKFGFSWLDCGKYLGEEIRKEFKL